MFDASLVTMVFIAYIHFATSAAALYVYESELLLYICWDVLSSNNSIYLLNWFADTAAKLYYFDLMLLKSY